MCGIDIHDRVIVGSDQVKTSARTRTRYRRGSEPQGTSSILAWGFRRLFEMCEDNRLYRLSYYTIRASYTYGLVKGSNIYLF